MVTAQFGDALASNGLREIQRPEIAEVVAAPADRLGPRAQLAGPWEGAGFNAISRSNDISHGGQDRFLELNITKEKLSSRSMHPSRSEDCSSDINMFGGGTTRRGASSSRPPVRDDRSGWTRVVQGAGRWQSSLAGEGDGEDRGEGPSSGPL
jgi:hypothetical protein